MTVIENLIKEIDDMQSDACDAVYETAHTDKECDSCPFYSSVHGCGFNYILGELEHLKKEVQP